MTALRAGEIARDAGVNPQTLRYYERRGLLRASSRTNGGHRLYDAEAVTRLRVIKAAQRLGFTLEEVAHLIEAARHHHGDAPAGLQIAVQDKLVDIDQRIADLELIRATLRAAVDAGCDDLIECSGVESCPIQFGALSRSEA